jgi:hypothetical protein
VIRECPGWFQDELTRVGGTNRYGDPLFKLVWSSEPRTIVGGRFADGFVGYRNMPAIPGEPCWALMIWEGPEAYGDPLEWEYQYRQPDTGCLDCGSFPKEGRYRLLKQFMHRELVRQEVWKIQYNWKRRKRERVLVQRPQLVTTKMEPCGLILDLMIPMLQAWRRLTFAQKLEAVEDRKKRQDAERDRVTKDAMHDSRVRRGSQLVQKRAELIEKGMDQAMKIASQYGRGMVTALN